MVENIKFSLLIANYNNGHFFEDCYYSIIPQTYTNWEVIIVDDKSTDNSVAIIKEFIKGDKRFKLFLNSENKGCGYTKNKCAYKSQGEILGFLDPDDGLFPEAIEEMVNGFIQNSEAVLITSKHQLFDVNMNYIREGEHGEPIPNNQSYLTYGKGAFTHFACFKKDAFLNMCGLDIVMKRAVDQDLYYKLEEQGEHVFLNKFLYKYRLHKNGISQNENYLKAKYWHCYALEQAYRRRQKNSSNVRNISRKARDSFWINYYYQLYESSKENNTNMENLNILYNLIRLEPFQNMKFKLKNLLFLIYTKR